MKTAKKLTLWLGALGIIILMSTSAKAASTTLTIRVSINAATAVTVSTVGYQFGALPVSSAAVSLSSITVTNTSNGLLETYTLQGADAQNAGATDTWTLAPSTGTNIYSLAAIFNNNTQPILTAFGAEDYLNNSTPVVSDGTKLTNGVETGAAVPVLATRGLWFRINTPGSVSDMTEHKATLTLVAQ